MTPTIRGMTFEQFEQLPFDEQMAVLPTKRTCGDCTLCCTVMAVEELGKPENTPCSFLKKDGCGGCAIYPKHPDQCKGYICFWRGCDILPESWRPDKKGFLVHFDAESTNAAAGIMLDPARPNAWLEGNNPTNLALIAVQLGWDLAIMNGPRVIGGITKYGHLFTRQSEPWRFTEGKPNMVGFDE